MDDPALRLERLRKYVRYVAGYRSALLPHDEIAFLVKAIDKAVTLVERM
jgi:hypothetical protein